MVILTEQTIGPMIRLTYPADHWSSLAPWRNDLSVADNHKYAVQQRHGDDFIGGELSIGTFVCWVWVKLPQELINLRRESGRAVNRTQELEHTIDAIKMALGVHDD